MTAHRERDSAPRSGALRREFARPSARGALFREPPPLERPADLEAKAATDESAQIATEPVAEAEIAITASVAEQCVPDRSLRFSDRHRRSWRDRGVIPSLVSIAIHAGAVIAAVLAFEAPPAYESGGEEAIPIEVVVAGAQDSAASEAGARSADVKIDPPDLPEPPPIEIAQPKVEVPPVPETPPVEIAATPVEVPPVPDAPPVLATLTPPVLSTPTPAPEPDPVPAPTPPIEQAQPQRPALVAKPPEPQKPVARKVEPKKVEPKKIEAKKVEPKKVEPKRVASRPVAEPQPQHAPTTQPASTAGRGRGDAGAGESDRRSVASTRGASGGPGAGGGAAAVAGYRARVIAHLQRFKAYPEQARERGVTGRAIVSFTLSRSGQVVSASLSGSSGAAMLDQATLGMVRRAAPFPPMPEGGPSVMSFNAAINYNLRN